MLDSLWVKKFRNDGVVNRPIDNGDAVTIFDVGNNGIFVVVPSNDKNGVRLERGDCFLKRRSRSLFANLKQSTRAFSKRRKGERVKTKKITAFVVEENT